MAVVQFQLYMKKTEVVKRRRKILELRTTEEFDKAENLFSLISGP